MSSPSRSTSMSLSMSSTSRISTKRIKLILDSLKLTQTKTSTKMNYADIWKNFNTFVTKLDKIPRLWKDRVALYAAYFVDCGVQSSTLKSYISAIKTTLQIDGYKWKDGDFEISTFTKACRYKNDVAKTRLPIHVRLLELIIFELQRHFFYALFAEALFKAVLMLGYYGMMWVGELTTSDHVLKVKDIHIGKIKDKILIILYSSKTHDESKSPQEIKIFSMQTQKTKAKRYFCPFQVITNYADM